GVGYPVVIGWGIVEGRWFGESDVRAASKVCLLGRTIVENLFAGRSPVGATVRIGGVPVEVIGVLSRRGSNAWGQDQDDAVILPWTTVRRRLSNAAERHVDRVAVRVASTPMIPRAQGEIETLLRERHRIREGEADDFHVRDLSQMMESFAETSRLLSTLLAAIASISLLVGGIGIMNIMLVSVTERTREIGLRLAVGARGGDILRQFLAEAVLLSLVGGLAGVALGVAASRLVTATLRWPTLLPAWAVALAVGCSAAVGIAFGFYPAWRASRLDPIECLRHE
ncbi:MAG: ABC transporter permease, partial [Planctomycetes bacterium]|nr:ABC transporter permease [Planctomycetota bacterium]